MLKTAVETSVMLLRIDDIVSGVKKGGDEKKEVALCRRYFAHSFAKHMHSRSCRNKTSVKEGSQFGFLSIVYIFVSVCYPHNM